MAVIKLPSLSDTFKVVLKAPIDSAVTCSSEEYKLYLETLDEAHLKLNGEPTRFVMRKVLPTVAASEVQNSQFSMKNGQMEFQYAFAMKEVQASLIGIENPSHLPPEEKLEFRKAQGLAGGAHDDLIAQLNAVGVIMDLYKARQTAVGGASSDLTKKK